ncbi:Hypothetical protein SMAX5B_016981 [Scophthalmus maximus]|uniref:Uncharacterized protein n=1 Tax=Scophthalmus maximus TaxID=52904 RepID=A0A2U9BA51_SCOMX|nr:Hypothetical protein SMAX5B_016981 [Scophthalmus maximus]
MAPGFGVASSIQQIIARRPFRRQNVSSGGFFTGNGAWIRIRQMRSESGADADADAPSAHPLSLSYRPPPSPSGLCQPLSAHSSASSSAARRARQNNDVITLPAEVVMSRAIESPHIRCAAKSKLYTFAAWNTNVV